MGYVRTCGSAFWPQAQALRTPLPRVSVDTWIGSLSVGFCALFMLSPVFNPWYLVWWLPIACLHPTLTPWVCAWVLMLSYITGLHTGIEGLPVYGQPVAVIVLEFGLIYWALIQDLRRPLSGIAAYSDKARPLNALDSIRQSCKSSLNRLFR